MESTRRVIPGRGGRDPVQQPGLGHPSGNHEQAFLHQSLGRAQTMDPRVFRLHAIWIFFVVIRLQGVFSPPDPEHPAAYSRVQESIDRVERLGTPFHHAHSAAPRAKLQLPRYYCGFKDGTGLLGGLDHAIASHGYSSENTALSCRASSCSSAPIASRALVHHVKKIAAVYKVPPSSEPPFTRFAGGAHRSLAKTRTKAARDKDVPRVCFLCNSTEPAKLTLGIDRVYADKDSLFIEGQQPPLLCTLQAIQDRYFAGAVPGAHQSHC
ncbi:hypothetical protein BC828DRAFT_249608 [Blastocladiella britannica]|nr:hypothetical protein BC828DRAFT_249608 [Blastocladiella britannica]